MSDHQKNARLPKLAHLGLGRMKNFHFAMDLPRRESLTRWFFPKEVESESHRWVGSMTTLEAHAELELPPASVLDISLTESLMKRESARPHNNQQLTLDELSSLLWWSAGKCGKAHRRHYPSAGGLYPVEVLPLMRDCESAPPCTLAHYLPPQHRLAFLKQGQEIESLIRKSKNDNPIINPHLVKVPLLIFLCAKMNRLIPRYREKSYLLSVLEAGHIAQNIYLVGNALGLKVCGIGEIPEAESLQSIFNGMSHDMMCLYIISIGKEN